MVTRAGRVTSPRGGIVLFAMEPLKDTVTLPAEPTERVSATAIIFAPGVLIVVEPETVTTPRRGLSINR